MIGALALWLGVSLQVASARSGALEAIVVKDAQRQATVRLTQGPEGPALRLEQLAPIVDVTVLRGRDERFVVRTGGVDVEMAIGLPYARVGGETRQLVAAPFERGGAILVPLQFVSEVLPHFSRNGIIWDAQRRELRRFSTVVRHSPPPERRAAEALAENQPSTAAVTVTHSGPRRPGSARRTVVVDAGHGGPDRGMHGPIGGNFVIHESDITLEVSRRLGAKLRALGVDVVFTRTTDTLIALSDRGRIANEADGDLFISVHVNAANPNWKNPGGARGFETYFLAEAKTEDARRVERMENEAIRFETVTQAKKGDPLSFILNDMAQNEHLRESSELAELIQRRMAQSHPGTNRGVKQAGFRVLVTAFMPAVLVEIGFGTNPAEARYISDSARQEEIAQSIADGAIAYLERYERRVTGGTRGRGQE